MSLPVRKTNGKFQQVRIENPIGCVQVPVGLAGPLWVWETGTSGAEVEEVYAPLATTEAALWGIYIIALRDAMSKVPAFIFDSPVNALAFAQKVPTLQGELKRLAESTSRRIQLLSVTPTVVGSATHLHFNYKCGDATGQNMASIATHRACHELLIDTPLCEDLKIRGFLFEAGTSGEKKAGWSHVQEPRGVEAMVWGTISNEVAGELLGCSTEAIYQALTRAQAGSVRAGEFGYAGNVMNAVTAIFIATGQDVASISESCWTQLTPEYNYETKVLTLSLYIPPLPVGVVGGGTHLGPQREALEIMKCIGPGKKRRLAALITAFALALDLSSTGAVTNDTFSQAHAGLRRKPDDATAKL
ncbi:hmg-CoA reductase [Aspergillus neoniger CBS 115656]|uniref:hydroxymethylglutaryl-CoA reductase (NADPH) n=1 Tax=Aspergillus neoniger (strain CBS 115656) TaxID=1448310 RepID=A0A318YM71_ASPNB|nr:hmg-CoA reductase [Aspergillus neoniger CBS 115656]PYH35314.1 hmg-CoA reductase [Aspergillus neoniger CBS 115656]